MLNANDSKRRHRHIKELTATNTAKFEISGYFNHKKMQFFFLFHFILLPKLFFLTTNLS